MSTIAATAVRVTANTAEFHRRMDKVEQTYNRNLKTAKMVGTAMTKYVSLPLIGAGVMALRASMQFETSMAKIVGLVGVARSEVDQWKESIFAVSRATGVLPQQLGEAMYFITSAGLRGAVALETMTISARAQAAGLGAAATVADLLTSAINAYGHENLSAAQAADILTAAVREGKAQAVDLTAAMGMVLPVASEMKIAFGEVAGMIAAMTRTGTDAGTAAIQLRQIMAQLLKPAAEAEKMLAAYGTSASDVRREIREKGLLAVLKDLKDRFGDNEEAASKVFGNIRALAGVLDLLGANYAQNAATVAATTNAMGDLDNAYSVVEQTMQHRWNQAMSGVQTNLIRLGDILKDSAIPALEKLIKKIENTADWFGDLNQSEREAVIQLGAVAIATGPVILGFLKILQVIKWIKSVGMPSLAGIIGAPGGMNLAAMAFSNIWDKNPLQIQERDKIMSAAYRKSLTEFGRLLLADMKTASRGYEEWFSKLTEWPDVVDFAFQLGFSKVEENLDRLDSRLRSSSVQYEIMIGNMRNLMDGLHKAIPNVVVATRGHTIVSDTEGNIISDLSRVRSTITAGAGDGSGTGGGSGTGAGDGNEALVAALDAISTRIEIAKTQFAIWKLETGESAVAAERLAMETQHLNEILGIEQERVAMLSSEYESMAAAQGHASDEARGLLLELLLSKKAVLETTAAIGKLTSSLSWDEMGRPLPRMIREAMDLAHLRLNAGFEPTKATISQERLIKIDGQVEIKITGDAAKYVDEEYLAAVVGKTITDQVSGDDRRLPSGYAVGVGWRAG